MYNKFFGFKERPFKLVPNPEYLYLSRSHEEALAHLNYAVSEGDGFVEITGEVGTGKTTLCRAFLERLDSKAEAAFIFNPKLDSIQLLKAINSEFGIKADADNVKDLTDALNVFLIEIKRDGKKAIILIDEAQNLERPVLEQLRLLSNLETTKEKLLQIILVGQPELEDMLDEPELRQLRQRITLSCHLKPFNFKDTKAYITHRINIASQKAAVKFTRGAFREVYKYSRGIPRLINIVCDRALLTAFGLNKTDITGFITKSAVRELSGKGDEGKFVLFEKRHTVYIYSILLLALLTAFFYFPDNLNIGSVFNAKKKNSPDSSQNPEPTIKNQGKLPQKVKPAALKQENKVTVNPELILESKSSHKLEDYLKKTDTLKSRQAALKAALDMWGIKSEIMPYTNNIAESQVFFSIAAKQNGFLVQRIESDFELVEKLNLPAVLEFNSTEMPSAIYLAVCRIQDGLVLLKTRSDEEGITVETKQLQELYSGTAYIPWKNFYDYRGMLPINSSKETIVTLKMHIRDIGYDDIEINPEYDEKTKETIKNIQEKHGLPKDGLIGPLTKIILYNEVKRLNIPHIR